MSKLRKQLPWNRRAPRIQPPVRPLAAMRGEKRVLGRCGGARQSGVALVIVLWMVALLAVIAASHTYSSRAETALGSTVVGRAQALAVAQAALVYVVMDLRRSQDERRVPLDGTPYRWHFGDASAEISLVDVGGLIDLNTAPRELLQGALEAAGLDAEDEREALLDAIEDWKDADDLRRLDGAEYDDYADAGFNYGPKNGSFDSVDELLQVMGMPADVFERIRPNLTVYSRARGVDPEVSPDGVLRSLPDVDVEDVEAFIQERAERHEAEEQAPLWTAGGGNLAAAPGLAYSTTVKAVAANAVTLQIGAVIALDVDPVSGRPFTVLEWRENL